MIDRHHAQYLADLEGYELAGFLRAQDALEAEMPKISRAFARPELVQRLYSVEFRLRFLLGFVRSPRRELRALFSRLDPYYPLSLRSSGKALELSRLLIERGSRDLGTPMGRLAHLFKMYDDY